MLRDALTSWKIGNYFSSLFLTSTSGIRRKERIEANVWLLRSIEPRSNFRSKYRLQACTSVTSYRAPFEHLRVTRKRELASFNLRARFIIMAAVFDRFVIPRFFARASPLLFPGCFHSRVLLQFPMRIGYFGLPPGSSLSRAERKSRHRISGIRGTNDFVGWLRYLKLDTPRDPANIPFPISDALFLSFRFTFESSLCELIAT